jgi:hypothetical protein
MDQQATTISLDDLDDRELVEQFTYMVKWDHYDPMGAERPSIFDTDELGAEIRQRMQGKQKASRELLDAYAAMIKWNHYDPHGFPRPGRRDEYTLRHEVLKRMDA